MEYALKVSLYIRQFSCHAKSLVIFMKIEENNYFQVGFVCVCVCVCVCIFLFFQHQLPEI